MTETEAIYVRAEATVSAAVIAPDHAGVKWVTIL